MGVCYSLFDSQKLIDYGIGYVRPVCSIQSIKKVEQYLEFYKPDVVLLRGMSKRRAKRSKRTKKLIDLICKVANVQGLSVHQYNRSQIKDVFSQFKSGTSKYKISQKLIEWFPQLAALEIPERKRWMAENNNTGVFDAIALGVVYIYENE